MIFDTVELVELLFDAFDSLSELRFGLVFGLVFGSVELVESVEAVELVTHGLDRAHDEEDVMHYG